MKDSLEGEKLKAETDVECTKNADGSVFGKPNLLLALVFQFGQ